VISLLDIKRGWNQFFFEPASPLPIGIYRFLLGFLLLLNYALMYPDLLVWFGQRGVLTPQNGVKLSGGAGLNLLKFLPPSDTWIYIFFGFSCLVVFLLMIGLFTRASAILVFVTLVTVHHRNPLILNSGDSFLRIASFFIIFSHAGAAFSADRLIRLVRGKESGLPQPRAPWAMRMIQLQLAFLYFYAFVWKMMGDMWTSGTAVYYTSRLMDFWRFPVPYIFEHMWTIKLWTWSTLVLEFALGVLVWIKEFRYWVLLGGVLLHAGIDYSMNIPLFGFIMCTAYITFVEPADLQRFWQIVTARVNKRISPKIPIPVFYDGTSLFCRRALEVVRSLDILHRFAFHDVQSAKAQGEFKDLGLKRSAKEMLVKVNGIWLGGFSAFRFVAQHLPLFWLTLPFLYLPMIRAVGDRSDYSIPSSQTKIVDLRK
jgi:predicted DCC family thiol-disulfide oxidoreductase YuxK